VAPDEDAISTPPEGPTGPLFHTFSADGPFRALPPGAPIHQPARKPPVTPETRQVSTPRTPVVVVPDSSPRESTPFMNIPRDPRETTKVTPNAVLVTRVVPDGKSTLPSRASPLSSHPARQSSPFPLMLVSSGVGALVASAILVLAYFLFLRAG
jgi:hypothetical protein